MTRDKKIIVLIDNGILINVGALGLFTAQRTSTEEMALYENVIVLIDHSVVIDVAKIFCFVNGRLIGISSLSHRVYIGFG
jgi:hypothetical protein